MTRYINQRDQFSCVPVVILNARKWLGHKVSYDRDYMNTRCQAGVIKGKGAYATGFLRASRKLPKTRICRPNWTKIKRTLKSGNAVIVRSRWDYGGHIFLVTRMTDRSIFCVNVYGGHRWLSIRLFRSYYLHPGAERRGNGRRAAWIIWKPHATP